MLEEQPLYHTCSEEHDGWSTMNAYPIQFADGTATVYITDLFEHRYTDYATAADLLVFFVCFVAIMVALIQRKVRVIKTLESELRILEGGDLTTPLPCRVRTNWVSWRKALRICGGPW